MTKLKGGMKKPVTWGGYIRLSVVCILIYLVEIALMFGWFSNVIALAKVLFKKHYSEPNKNVEETEEES